MKRPRNHQAFSLVELLVVVTIIAILAGILFALFPEIARRRDQAAMISNLRQIGAGLIGFTGENNGSFPIAGSSIAYGAIDSDTGKPSWQEQIDPFVSNARKIFANVPPEKLDSGEYRSQIFFGCMAVYAEMRQNGQDFSFGTMMLPKIDYPAKYLLAAPVVQEPMFNPEDADKDNYVQDPFFGKNDKIEKPAPVCFADGHVAMVKSIDEVVMTYDGSGRPDFP